MSLNKYISGGLSIRSEGINSEDPIWHKGSGIISDPSVDSHFTRMSKKLLEKFTESSDTEEIPVLVHHDSDAQIGKSFSARLNEKDEVEVEFGIRKELELNSPGLSSSDDYAKSIDSGIIKGLSVGFLPKEMTCDRCEKEMEMYSIFGMLFSRCENKHYLGQKLYIDDEGKEHTKKAKDRKEVQVTALINDGDLREFSLVSFPSNKNAKILNRAKEAFKEGKFKEEHLHQLSLNYGITRSVLEEDQEPQMIPTRGDTTMDNDKKDVFGSRQEEELKEDIRRLQEEKKNLQTVASENQRKAERAEDKISDLETQVAELENIEEGYHQTREELKEKNKYIEDIDERLKTVRKNEYKVQRYDECVVQMRAAVKKAWGQANDDATAGEQERKFKEIDTCDDLGFLIERVQSYTREARKNHSDRWKTRGTYEGNKNNHIDFRAFQV